MIRIAAFTGGCVDPSSRYRIRQHIPRLHAEGIHVIDYPARNGRYAPSGQLIRPWWAASLLVERLAQVMKSVNVHATLLQKEMMATLCTWEPYTRGPRILDVDDAIYLRRRGRPARRLASIADHIICGNPNLAEWFGQWHSNITVIPTGVDTQVMRPRPEARKFEQNVVVGWIGSSANHRYLPIAAQALAKVMKRFSSVKLTIISDQDPDLPEIDPERRDFIRWSADDEAEAVAQLDIGIMPLADTAWERGKCSYKMLQYMACGVPVVVSPVGMNAHVLACDEVGVGAVSESDWIEALSTLVTNESMRKQFGNKGRAVVESQFSTTVVRTRLKETLRMVVGAA